MKAFTSFFSGDITGLIEQKRSIGYKYQSEAGILSRFDLFCSDGYPGINVLNRELAFAWSRQRPDEHPSTLQGRITPVRELAKYIIRNGREAFVLPEGIVPKCSRYLPYIYSDDELKRIFVRIDRCHYCAEVPYRHYVMPVFFRLLYCCGLRLTEARMLKVKDVDMENGVITLTNTKMGRYRQIPLSEELYKHFISYYKNVHTFSKPDDWFFPGYKGNPMTLSNVDKNHRKFLWQARISHPGRTGLGQRGAPTVHSFRHTFAVHCLRRWIREGKNLQAWLPVLQSYMGHVSFSGTACYLHLTTDLFPDITTQLDKELGDIIPVINHTNYNDDEKSN
ncbi:MAG: tyrosine-type recombinase/integrase [Oscillospiraceae bacterium]|jgi:integrase|nr:tyrosine-type recombinase/integrase [Oscillospiraceae bacterium]